VIRGIFGFDPSIAVNQSRVGLKRANVSRGFNASLKHLRYKGQLFTIRSDSVAGLSVEME
jgi:hypothetical protein